MDKIENKVKNYNLNTTKNKTLNSSESSRVIDGIINVINYTDNPITEMIFDEEIEINDNEIKEIYEIESGGQSELYALFDSYCKDENIHKIMKKYFGDDYTIEDMELLFYRIKKTGCGYVAAINIIMEEYSNKLTKEEFEEMFGFPLERERKVTLKGYEEDERIIKEYNTAYMTLDFFLFYATQIEGYKRIEEVYGNALSEKELYENSSDGALDDYEMERTGQKGTYLNEVGEVVKKYLKEKGYTVNTINNDERIVQEIPLQTPSAPDLDINLVKRILDNNSKLTIGAIDFTLYLPYDKNNNGKLDDIAKENVGSHAMTVVGISGDGKLLVDSWGKQYLIDPEEINDEYGEKVIHSYCIYQFE